MGAGVGLAVPALALDGLLRLAAAARVAVVGDKAGLCALFFSGHKNSFRTRLPMHMRYGILDVSAGRESLTALFFSDMHPMRAPAAFIVQGCRDLFFLHKRPRWWKHWRGR